MIVIEAAASGKVIHKSSDTGYGNMLIIKHDHGLETYYAHLNKFHNNIQVGKQVQAVETIGYVGSTGHSTGPHLHYEVWKEFIAVDPLIYFPEYARVDLTSSYYD